MGKDGGGGDGGGYGGSTYTTVVSKTIHDVHIAALQVIENELERLHKSMQMADGDVDVMQEQIGNLHDELVRLSEALGDAEIECATSGN